MPPTKVLLASIATHGGSAYARLGMWQKEYGAQIDFEWRGTIFPAKIYRYKGELRLMYREPKQHTQYVPFALELDPITPHEVHIHNIHRTPEIRGTQMVNFVLAVCRKLGAKKASLQDAATVVCRKNGHEMNLSLISLLKSGKTFYERFGFQITLKKSKKQLAPLLEKIRSVPLQTVCKRFEQAVKVLQQALKDSRTFELRIKGRIGYPDVYMRDPVKEIPEKLKQYKRILGKLRRSNSTMLTDFLVYSAQHQTDCAIYTDFLMLAFQEHRIVYRGKEVVVNKWARILDKITYTYEPLLHINF